LSGPLRRPLSDFVAADQSRVVYLDIETAGMKNKPLFLVGTMEYRGGEFLIRQFFARHYGEEAPLLADLNAYLRRFEILVTFNGRMFDVPYMLNRASAHRLDLAIPPLHIDLLPESRLRWRRLLPNCRLVTLEEFLCRRRRVGDVPSRLIPAVYREYLRSGDARKMGQVIHHNVLDLVAMAELILFIIAGRKDWE